MLPTLCINEDVEGTGTEVPAFPDLDCWHLAVAGEAHESLGVHPSK
jgi:hypothetical protein